MSFYNPLTAKLSYEQISEASTVSVVAEIAGVAYLIPNASVEMNAYGANDSATVKVPIKGSPDWTTLLYSKASTAAVVPLNLYVGLTQGQAPTANVMGNVSLAGLTLIFAGQIDLYEMNLHDDETTFHCRSLGAPLIDNRLTSIPLNQSTSDFVTKVAAQYGLKAVTTFAPGHYPLTIAEVYQHEFAVGIQNDRIWDMLIKCAEFDDVDVWVTPDGVVHYESASVINRKIVDLKWGRDLETLSIQHSPAFSKKIRVEVRTYNQRTRQSTITRADSNDGGGQKVSTVSKLVTSTPIFGTTSNVTQTISSTGSVSSAASTTSGGGFGATAGTGKTYNGPEIYKIYKPGISPQAANALAQSTWRRISSQEYTATIKLPLTRTLFPLLSVTSKIRLHGVPFSSANGDYFTRKMTWNFDINDGASVTVDAVNHVLPGGQA